MKTSEKLSFDIENYAKVYESLKDNEPDLAFLQSQNANYAQNFHPDVVSVDESTADDLDALIDDGHRVIICPNHIVYDDQFYVAAAMHDGKLGSKINEHPTTIIAKDEYFRDEQGRAFMESMNALPAYRYKDHGQLGLVGRAGAALIEACTHRLVRGDNLVIFGEGERNITGDPTRVQ